MELTDARWRTANNLPGRVLVRDSKDRDGGTLAFAPAAWRAFVAAAKAR
ncbi:MULTISPECIES: DUF397 domain-containing protein [Micromonospora]|uniref:DUF397 domain-containing protein n=1 Tax=Micromonospora solifontis TaxID=2487138 RepID=A0ABX9WJS7_9ACTN|nr:MULTISPECIES: DUF397 domain-containing protein [Micromonospora]NES15240.1 DUF397 domain-containing protein [Micromonospora sp. PPF5-17B]NES36512.1 DUF397 domain-containing protein [Micromonospora solifontis]NES56344.1 DUF397 domain-containing protein [Micromonospora sp. PPF5-6]RNL99402.1 DUF397 domain-containing protein [Micromonospora solifontis]